MEQLNILIFRAHSITLLGVREIFEVFLGNIEQPGGPQTRLMLGFNFLCSTNITLG